VKILNLINAGRGDIAFKRFRFPDGQAHMELESEVGEWEHVQILARLRSAEDILELGMAVDCVRSYVRGRISVNIAYMLGARMDRAIGAGKPFTLQTIAGMVNAACAEANDVRILDPHSPVTTQLVKRSTHIDPTTLVESSLSSDDVVVIPDKGAIPRTTEILRLIKYGARPIATCDKVRDPATGKLSGFTLVWGDVKGRSCLIVDDLCDGGGTFAGVAGVLREAGATAVKLCVTHGVFSRGLPIAGIDCVYTTDSYQSRSSVWHGAVDVAEDYLLKWVTGSK
jgi:ribose-phosphate pyrophosphokinase